jgi:hypothetical protein
MLLQIHHILAGISDGKVWFGLVLGFFSQTPNQTLVMVQVFP